MLSLESASLPDESTLAAQEPRQAQLDLLTSWLLPVPAQAAVWCWGGPGTGKTHLVRRVLAREQHVAFLDCTAVVTANRLGRSLFDNVLNQLSGHEVGPQSHWTSKWTCANTATFAARLLELNDESCRYYVVFDNADELMDGVEAQVFSFLVEMAQELSQMALGVVFIARRDWRQSARGFCGGSHPLEVHFEAWSEAEQQQMLLQMVSEAEKREAGSKWRLTHRSAREKWTARLLQSVQGVTAPLFGLHNLFNMELDGFKVHQSPMKQPNPGVGEHRNKVEQEQARLGRQYLNDVYCQEADKLMQLDDLSMAVVGEASTPHRASTPVIPMESASKRQRMEAKQQEARGERFAVLSIGPQLTPSLPVHEAALVVAGFCASVVPKGMDSQIFSESHTRKKQNKSKATVGAGTGAKTQRVKSFSLDRLLLVFRHVIGKKDFVPSSFWFSCVESVTNAGYLRRRFSSSTKASTKFICETPLAQVTRLALEIGYKHLDDVLAAQL